MNISLLYEDQHILAINKPAGLVVHSDGRTKERTLSDLILKNYPETKKIGEPIKLKSGEVIYRPGIVHRLDRETSGVLLVAKTSEGFFHLKKQFQQRIVGKTYLAFVYGIIKEDDGVINRPIARSRKDFRLWSAQRGSKGQHREAETYFKVLRRRENIGEIGATFIEINPKTGRTHQIRVHFKAVNHPIVCDKLYAPKRPAILDFNRLALHSFKISFENLEGKSVEVEAPLPADFKVALSNFS